MSFDIFTLSTVVSGLSILGAVTMYSQQYILFHHKALGHWVLGGLFGSIGFVAMLFYAQIGVSAIFLHTVGSLLSFYFLYKGVRAIEHAKEGSFETMTDLLFVMGSLILSWLVRDDTTIRYMTHDLVVTSLGIITLWSLWVRSNRLQLYEYTIAIAAYLFVVLAFLGRFFLALYGTFDQKVNHPYNEIVFLIVIFWICGWTYGLSLILHKQKQREVEGRLLRDGLTGLLNRSGILHVTNDWIQEGSPFYLYVLDLNDFKQVNDTFGHLQGDKALQAYTSFIHAQLPATAMFARIGGDEFVILSPYKMSLDAMKLNYDFSIDGIQVTLDAAIGQAMFPIDGNTLESLFLAADEAMYLQKSFSRVQ